MNHSSIRRRALLVGAGSLVAQPSLVRAQNSAGVALVIGNSKYKWEASLPNAKRDASDIARCFQQMGLKTELVQDAGQETILAALERFKIAAKGAAFAAFYFAGHGVARAKNTYIVPTDTDLGDPSTIRSLVRARVVVDAMREASIRFLVFDNCRNSPADDWRNQEVLDEARGSGVILSGDGEKLPPDTHVIFSTAPGRVAVDGPAGQNSPFVAVVLRTFAKAKIDLLSLDATLRRDLLVETEGRQLVWSGHSYSKQHIIDGAGSSSALPPAHAVEASRIVDLGNAYSFAKEIRAPLVPGIVAIRPPSHAPNGQFVGSYKLTTRDNNPTLWIVVSATNKTTENVIAQRLMGNPSWRFLQGKLSGSTIEALLRSGGDNFQLTWKDANSGSVVLTDRENVYSARESRTFYRTSFVRLDG